MKISPSTQAVYYVMMILLIGSLTTVTLATTPVPLGSNTSFIALAGSAITVTGGGDIWGDVGVSPGSAFTPGNPAVIVHGNIYLAVPIAAAAQADLTAAYNDAAGRPVDNTIGTELGGTTPLPGVYTSGSGTFGITGTLTLDALGNSSAVWIFKMASTLITASNSQVILAGGAKVDNIFWQVGSSATLGTNSNLKGTVLAQASITSNTGARLTGRALARTGAVTLDSPSNSITLTILTAMTNVTHAAAMPSYGGITLVWMNPIRSDYAATLVVYRDDRYPVNEYDGNIAYWYNGTQTSFAGTNGHKYYFGIFAHDTAMNFAPGVFMAGIPNSYSNVKDFTMYTPWIGAAGFRWINPVETGQHDSEILIRREDRLPASPADGYNSVDSTWFRYWWNGQDYREMKLTLGTTYYYGLYAVDTMMNFSGGFAGAFIPGDTGISNVSTVRLVPGYGTISVNWINPNGSNYASTLIVKQNGRFPANPTDGTVAYWFNGESFQDPGLTIGQPYFYGIFAQDTAGKFSPGIFVEEYTGNYANVKDVLAVGGNNGGITLNWQNPNRTDYQKTMIIRNPNQVPANAFDGTQVYWGNGTTFSDASVTYGQRYYYSLIAHDSSLNPSEGMGISTKPTSSATGSPSLVSAPAVLKASPTLAQLENTNIGWNDNLGDFSQPNKAYFWVSNGQFDQQNGSLVLQGNVTKLTLKNYLIGKPVQVVITYTADKSVTITPGLLVNNGENTISPVFTSFKNQAFNRVATSEIQGYGDQVQLQLVIQNPAKSVIQINSIQLTPLSINTK